MGRTVKIILFIGLFLLIIGICLYGYVSYEGFQTGIWNEAGSISFCDVNANKCNTTCHNKVKERGALPAETSDETTIYDVYEGHNLENMILPPQKDPTTTVKAHDMASELSDFDPQAPMPWDYDNRQLDPQQTVWGAVHSDVSHMLYQKAYNRAIFGSSDPSSFIENNNDTGQNSYRSNMYATTVYGTSGMAGMAQADAIGEFYTTVLVQQVLENVFLTKDQRYWQQVVAVRNASRPVLFTIPLPGGLSEPISKWWAPPSKSWAESIAEVNSSRNIKARITEVIPRIKSVLQDSIPNYSPNGKILYRNLITGELTREGRAALERRTATVTNIATNQVERGNSRYGAITRALDLTGNKSARLAEKRAVRAALGTELRPIATALRHVADRVLTRAGSRWTGKFVKNIFRLIAGLVLTDVVLTATCAASAARAAGGAAAAGAFTFGIGALALVGIEVSYSAACNIAITGLNAITGSLVTWIPQLMAQLVDEQISVCPTTHPWNLKRAFYDLGPVGEVAWEIFSVLPLVGDVSYMIMPYICWGTPNGRLEGVLRQNIKSPYYYYDPTLSIYTAEKTYAKTASVNNPTQLTDFTSGIPQDDPAYTNHYLYKDPYKLYPFLVDFSHTIMLNKMAQYYYDTSRKNMTVNYDGTATFEYISKIYGIMSSSELSCDIQCEISIITIDTLHGTKLCEKIVEVPANAPAWYHDRRFYFYVDITQGISLANPVNEKCEEYLNYVQTPTPYNLNPKCSDYDMNSGSSGRSGSDCSATLWPDRQGAIGSIYTNGIIDFNLIREATASCNKKLLTSANRENWTPLERMMDNMRKYVVTGCTYVDGTAPDVYDSKNQNVEGVQVGDTPVAIGPIGGGWYPPQFTQLEGVSMQPTGTPTDNSCNLVRNRFTKYGTVSRSDRNIDAAANAAAAPNITNIAPAINSMPWDKTIIKDWKNRANPIDVDFSQVAKSMTVYYTDCASGSGQLACVSSNRSFIVNMTVGSIMGALGSFGTLGNVPVGAMITSGLGTIGVQQYFECLVSDISAIQGTFVQNGKVRTSNQGAYVIDHGPTIQFSPGYSPEIILRDPGLNMQNCANRYTLRKFISLFTSKFPQYKLQNVFDISPRRRLSKTASSGSGPVNEYPCCIFGVEYTKNNEANAVANAFIRMDMVLNNDRLKDDTISLSRLSVDPATNQTENVLIYQPSITLLTNESEIPAIVPFTVSSSKPRIPSITVRNIAPLSCNREVDCSDPALQARLFNQFNQSHLGVFIDYNYGCPSSGSSGSTAGSAPLCVPPVQPSWTPAPTNGVNSCVFNVNAETLKYRDNESGSITLTGDPIRKDTLITMYLEPVQDPTTDPTGCLQDLAYDDYPFYVWYKKIPMIFFDAPVPPSEINMAFQRNKPNCPNVSDCASTLLLNNIITQFNKKHLKKKINTVYRAFTPLVLNPSSGSNSTVCDYDVEMIRTESNITATLANQETVRMYLKPSNTDQCLYDLASDDSDKTRSGLSLNNSQTTGSLASPYVWSSNFLYDVRKNLYDYILPVLGMDVVNTIQDASVSAKQTAKRVFDNTTQMQELRACKSLKCGDPYMLQKIINRYNFEASPAYPTPDKYVRGPQYGAQTRSILEFRRAGIASPTRCHVELIEAINTYDDLLYDAAPQNRRTYLRQYKFDINGNSCNSVSVAPLTLTDISKNYMDISGDAFGIDSDLTIVNPTGKLIVNPSQGSQPLSGASYFTYKTPMVNCMDPAILDKVQAAYEGNDVSSPNASPPSPAFNRMIHVLEWFNPAPNICEYKMNIQHTYFDSDYGYYYTVPESTQITGQGVNTVTFGQARFSDKDEASYIVAKWVPDWDYDIETGAVTKGKPIVDEYFYPDLTIRDGNFYRTPTSTVPLNLPYLAGEGLSAAGSANPTGIDYRVQKRRFTTSTTSNALYTFKRLVQTTLPSCRYIPDQQTTQASAEKSCAPTSTMYS